MKIGLNLGKIRQAEYVMKSYFGNRIKCAPEIETEIQMEIAKRLLVEKVWKSRLIKTENLEETFNYIRGVWLNTKGNGSFRIWRMQNGKIHYLINRKLTSDAAQKVADDYMKLNPGVEIKITSAH